MFIHIHKKTRCKESVCVSIDHYPCLIDILSMFMLMQFLKDFVNGGEVASFLDCIRLTAGPLLAPGGAIRPAWMPVMVLSGHSSMPKQTNNVPSQGPLTNGSSATTIHLTSAPSNAAASLGGQNLHTAAMLSAARRGGPGLVPSSLLPFDVSVVLRGPYWIHIIYHKKFSVDMCCFTGIRFGYSRQPLLRVGPQLVDCCHVHSLDLS
jgi:hypothetical protein